MTHLLDTNVFVGHLRKRRGSALLERVQSLNPNGAVVCSIVRAELLSGAHHSKASRDELVRVIELLSLFPSLPRLDQMT